MVVHYDTGYGVTKAGVRYTKTICGRLLQDQSRYTPLPVKVMCKNCLKKLGGIK